MAFFFFKQKTAYELRISDWSSDVCSSDLLVEAPSFSSEEKNSPSTGSGRTGMENNLLALAVECARRDATLGEISAAMEAAFGRYDTVPHPVRGIYTSAYADDARFEIGRAHV